MYHQSLADIDGVQGVRTPLKNHVVICVLRNTDTDLHRKAIGPAGPIASRGRSVMPSVNKFLTKKIRDTPPLTAVPGSAYVSRRICVCIV